MAKVHQCGEVNFLVVALASTMTSAFFLHVGHIRRCKVVLMRLVSAFVKNTPLSFERFNIPFSSRQRGLHFALSPRRLLTLQLSSSMPLAVGMRICQTHGFPGSTKISSFFQAF